MGKNAGISLFSFVMGAVFGAVVALLYAPTSGEELRAQIREEADTRWKQASAEIDKTLKSVQKSIDDLTLEVKGYLDQFASKPEQEQSQETE